MPEISDENRFHIVIVDPDKLVFEGDLKRAFIPGKVAELAILPQHTPLFTELTAGVIKTEDLNNSSQEFKIDGGVAKMQNNELHILIGY